MTDAKAKSSARAQQGRTAKAAGERFEALLSASFEYYARYGVALIEKTPEPMRVLKSLGQGRFIACYIKAAQPDYKGVLKGGRAIMIEAKFTSKNRIDQSRVLEQQALLLERYQRLGASAFVVVGFLNGGIYRVPWGIWRDMKRIYGRKYVTEDDLQDYRVPTGRTGIPLILG